MHELQQLSVELVLLRWGEGGTGWAVLNLLLGTGLTKPWDWGCDSQLLMQASGEQISVCCSRNEGPTQA